MSTTHLTLGAAADERKARLAKLKSLKRKNSDSGQLESESTLSPTAEEPNVTKIHLSGRNYDPEVKGPKLGFETRPDLAAKKTLEQQALDVEQEIRKQNQEEQVDNTVDLFKLQPKKPNWDLKRDLNKTLDILNIRTDNAIARLVRERIDGAKNNTRSNLGDKNTSISGQDEKIGIGGNEMVEGLKLREKEDENEEKRLTFEEEIIY